MNISNLNHAEVLAALYNNAKGQGLGLFLQAENGEMTKEEAQIILEQTHDKYFDYLKGRVMKIEIKGDELDTRFYDRDNGNGAAERAVSKLRAK